MNGLGSRLAQESQDAIASQQPAQPVGLTKIIARGGFFFLFVFMQAFVSLPFCIPPSHCHVGANQIWALQHNKPSLVISARMLSPRPLAFRPSPPEK